MDVTVNRKMNPVRVILAAVIVCVCLAVLFYIRANTVENIVASLVEKGSMDNMIWFVKYFSAFLPSIVMIASLTLFYGNGEKYIPVVTQKEKMIVMLIAAVFFFGVIMTYATYSVIPAVVEGEEVVKEATTVYIVLANWFFVQVIPFIIIGTYHCIKADSEKKALAAMSDVERNGGNAAEV
jgi:hypothetical protein